MYRGFSVLLAGVFASTSASAAVVLDGNVDAAYGAAKSVVGYNIAQPSGNFGAPVASSNAIGYTIYLSSDANYVYGLLKTSGPGTAVGSFANLYFDVDPGNGAGSDIGFEITNKNAIVFVGGGVVTVPAPGIQFFADATSVEFGIPTAYLLGPNIDLGDNIYLRLSQSFGYTVAGGGKFGPDGLGAVAIGGAAVPEPATWGMMILGFGLAGGALRQRKTRVA